jgi:hypothetical protein
LGAQTPRRPLQGCSTISTTQPSVSLTHSTKPPFLYATHGPDQLEPRKAALEWLQEVFAALMILNAGLMDEHVEDHPRSVDEQVPFAPFHFLAAVIAASPPFWLVFTD